MNGLDGIMTIYRFLRQKYKNINVANHNKIQRLLISYFDKIIYPHLDDFKFRDNLLFFVLPKFYGNLSKDTAVGVYQIVDPLRSYLDQIERNLVIYTWFPDDNSNFFSLLKFLKQVHTSGPKRIILDSPNFKSVKFKNFGIDTYCYLQKKYKIDFIELGWDTLSEKWWKDVLLQDLDRTILILDNPLKRLVPESPIRCGKAISVVPLFNLNQTTKVNNHRNIDFNFIGSVGSYRSYRREYLEYISELKYQSFIGSFDSRGDQLSRKDFLKVLGESKISINFSMTHSAEFQLKGRVWETMLSGSMLLEQDNDQIKQFFTEGIHYVSFTSKFELKQKLLHYLDYDSERIRIAHAGQTRAIELIQTSDMFKYFVD
jgi:hypothetical protein